MDQMPRLRKAGSEHVRILRTLMDLECGGRCDAPEKESSNNYGWENLERYNCE